MRSMLPNTDTCLYADVNNIPWATRNPNRAVINPRPPPTRLTDAQKASQAIAHEQRVKQGALNEEIKQFLTAQHDEIARIASSAQCEGGKSQGYSWL